MDVHYYGPRVLPVVERPTQGSDRISPFWQFGTYVQCELRRFFPWIGEKRGLRATARVDNLFNSAFPRYANDPSGAGVQCYGDWRGRTYSLSLTATFWCHSAAVADAQRRAASTSLPQVPPNGRMPHSGSPPLLCPGALRSLA